MAKERTPKASRNKVQAPQGLVTTESSKLIRHDLWQAFTAPDPANPARVYDVKEDLAQLLPQSPRRKGLVSIAPIPPDEQKAWAKSFVATIVEPTFRDALEKDLSRHPWKSRFDRRLKKHPELLKTWHAVQRDNVRDRIEAWKRKHRLTIDLLPKPSEAPSMNPTHGSRELELKRRVIRAIERMPLHDVASLKIPAGYLFD